MSMENPNRRDVLKGIGAGASAAVLASCAQHSSPPANSSPDRSNILLFLTDDHGQWAQHAYGNSELRTPNMDRLAQRGVRMTRAFTPCPVCSPARASFYTGRVPSQHGIHDWIEEATYAYKHPGLSGQTTIAQLLQKSGYHTGLVGKWHCGREREVQPGFDRWFGYWVNQYPHRGPQRFSDQGKEVNETGQQSPLLTQRVIDFLRDHKSTRSQQPFFLVVGYVDTHSPYKDHQEDLVDLYRQASFKDIPDEKFLPVHGTAKTPMAPNAATERERRMQYYAAVSSIDQQIGTILAELESTGQLDNTLIVYTSDHGLNAGHHGIWNKGNATVPQNFLEESILIPCTISYPKGGVRSGVTCDAMVDHCDLFNTLLDVAGVRADAKTQTEINSPGRSYLPMLRGQSQEDWRKAQFCEYGNARMIRTDRYKLILRYPYKGKQFGDELYDLKDDPRETRNVMTDATFALVIADLTQQLNAHFARYTLPAHDGLDLEHEPDCTPSSPWIAAAKRV
jgi:choline-sulfatase